MTPVMKNYPLLLRQLRDLVGISQEDLAHQLGVSFGTVNRWENGKVRPSKLAQRQLEMFIQAMIAEGKINPKDLKQE